MTFLQLMVTQVNTQTGELVMTHVSNKSYKHLAISFLLVAMSIALGAFAAHGLEAKLAAKYIQTFKTGVFYHQLHAVSLILFVIIEQVFKLKLTRERLLIYLGILLFSGNCYLYAITQIKTFALIVPFGGVSFIIAWSLLSYKTFRKMK